MWRDGVILVGPGLRSVDGVPIHSQPRAQAVKSLLKQWNDPPIFRGSDINEKVTTTAEER